MIELEKRACPGRAPDGRLAHIQEHDDWWVLESELPEMRFSTLGDAFDFFGEIECTVRTVAPLTATLNNLESIQVRYADVGYFGGLYKDAR